jgi:hypothetical protein
MNKVIIAALALTMFSPGAFAEQEASKEEAAKIAEVIKAFNCEMPKEIEKEDSGIFELDDVKCQAGQFDIKVGKDFKVMVITAD